MRAGHLTKRRSQARERLAWPSSLTPTFQSQELRRIAQGGITHVGVVGQGGLDAGVPGHPLNDMDRNARLAEGSCSELPRGLDSVEPQPADCSPLALGRGLEIARRDAQGRVPEDLFERGQVAASAQDRHRSGVGKVGEVTHSEVGDGLEGSVTVAPRQETRMHPCVSLQDDHSKLKLRVYSALGSLTGVGGLASWLGK